MNILLINPGWGKRISRMGRRFNRPWPPLSLMISAALLEKAGLNVRIIDGRVDPGWHEKLKSLAPRSDWIGLTSSPLDRWQCPNLDIEYFLELAHSLPAHKLLIMGAHGSIFPEGMLKRTGARAIIIGEPEMRLLEILTREDWVDIPGIIFHKEGKSFQRDKPTPTDLSTLPPPAFHLIDPSKYAYELLGRPFTILETSRGCPYGCTFCLKTMYGDGVRYKPIERLMVEIEQAVSVYGFRYGYFIDLEFTTHRARALGICDHLISAHFRFDWCCQTRADAVDADLLKRMKRAGCCLIHFGVESGSSHILKDTKKGINRDTIQKGIRLAQEAGIETACFFMFGFPGETHTEMEDTLNFAKMLNPTYASFHAVTPYPGTPLGDSACSSLEESNLDLNYPYYCSGQDPLFLNKTIRRAYLSYYLRFPYLLGRLKYGNPRSWLCQLKLFAQFLR